MCPAAGTGCGSGHATRCPYIRAAPPRPVARRGAGLGIAAPAAAVAAIAVALLCVLPSAAAAAAASDGDAAPRLAGMRLDGLAASGHAVVLEFAARSGAGDAGAAGPVQPGRLVLEGGLVRTESGPRALGGSADGASVMVAGGGTIVVRSTDRPAVVVAVPLGAGSGGMADRYAVTAYSPGHKFLTHFF